MPTVDQIKTAIALEIGQFIGIYEGPNLNFPSIEPLYDSELLARYLPSFPAGELPLILDASNLRQLPAIWTHGSDAPEKKVINGIEVVIDPIVRGLNDVRRGMAYYHCEAYNYSQDYVMDKVREALVKSQNDYLTVCKSPQSLPREGIINERLVFHVADAVAAKQ